MEKSELIHKTDIDRNLVQSFVEQNFNNAASNFQFIAGGESSQAFSFEVADESFVFRVSVSDKEVYKKDMYANKYFSLNGIPVPEVLEIGEMGNGYNFAISKKLPGETLNRLPAGEIAAVTPELVGILDSIHATDVSNTKDYGQWDSEGMGKQNSWKETLLEVDQYVQSSSDTPSLFDTSFVEKDVWNKIYKRFTELINYCPENRYLVHADYGGDNILVKDKKITGVLDWGVSMYGDFLYDIAWLDFWSRDAGYIEYYKTTHTTAEMPYFDERILCYQLYIILNSMSFFAYSNQQKKYDDLKDRADSLIK